MSKGENMVEAPYRYLTPEEAALLPEFEHPLVKLAYELLCDEVMPPEEEHWEGFAARRIVRAVIEALMEPTPEMVKAGWEMWRSDTLSDTDHSKRIFQAMLRTALSQPNDEGDSK